MSDFAITIRPTAEIHTQQLKDGRDVPLRVWQGVTNDGLRIEAYVFAITPEQEDESPTLRAALPAFMRPASDTYDLVVPTETDKTGGTE